MSLERGDTVQAVDCLEAVVKGDPSMAPAWFSLGRVYLAKGDLLNAQQALGAFIQSAGSRFPQEVAWAQRALAQLRGP